MCVEIYVPQLFENLNNFDKVQTLFQYLIIMNVSAGGNTVSVIEVRLFSAGIMIEAFSDNDRKANFNNSYA